MCRDTDSKEINETGLYRSEKTWKAILLRELKEIGVIQLNKENAENAQVKQTRVGGPPGMWYRDPSYYFQSHKSRQLSLAHSLVFLCY